MIGLCKRFAIYLALCLALAGITSAAVADSMTVEIVMPLDGHIVEEYIESMKRVTLILNVDQTSLVTITPSAATRDLTPSRILRSIYRRARIHGFLSII